LAHSNNFSFFGSESLLEIITLGELHVGGRFSLFIFEGAIEENNTRVFDSTTHLRVSHILVEHNTVKNAAVLKNTTGNFLDLSIAFGINLNVVTVLVVDSTDTFDGKVNDEVTPLGGKLSSNDRLYNFGEILIVFEVDRVTEVLDHLADVLKSAEISTDDNGGVDVFLQEALNNSKNLSSEDNDGGGTITDLFVLGTSELDHGLSSGVSDINL
jgi:hypothetical protein